jgi:hypothetical protein
MLNILHVTVKAEDGNVYERIPRCSVLATTVCSVT